MSEHLQNQLAAEARFMGGMAFAIQFEAGKDEPRPTDPGVRNLLHFVEGWLASRGAQVGPPFWRIAGRTIEIAVVIPHAMIDEMTDLFSSIERMGMKYRAGRMHGDGSWETLIPLPAHRTESFALLPDAAAGHVLLAGRVEREVQRLTLREAELRRAGGRLSEADARAQIDSLHERVEAVQADQERLRAMEAQAR